jgi:hypothetical protein
LKLVQVQTSLLIISFDNSGSVVITLGLRKIRFEH